MRIILTILVLCMFLFFFSCSDDSSCPVATENKIDTVFVLDTLGADLTQNYFPLGIGNTWNYNLRLVYSHGDAGIYGSYKWEIKSLKDSLKYSKVYLFEESFDGFRIGLDENMYRDTTIEKSSAEFVVIQNENRNITIIPPKWTRIKDSSGTTIDYRSGGITRLPLVEFQAFFSEDENEMINLTNIFYNNEIAVEFFADSDEDHNLRLQRNVGIISWKIESTHTGGWWGSLNLIP